MSIKKGKKQVYKVPKGWSINHKVEPINMLVDIVEVEAVCPHGVGHSKGVHGCDGCCADVKLPKAEKYKSVRGYRLPE